MIIGIDASQAFTKERTGTENYSWQLLLALAKLECEHELKLYVKGNPTGSASRIVMVTSDHPSRTSRNPCSIRDDKGANLNGPLGVSPSVANPQRVSIKKISWSYFWTQGGLALETWQRPTDLLFIPAHVIPFFKNPRVPVVVTVHDLGFEFLPWYQSPIQRFYLSKIIEKLRSRLATHIIAVSKSTKKDLTDKLGVPEGKITVVYEGIDRGRFTAEVKSSVKGGSASGGKNEKLKIIRKKYNIDGDYILFVGTIQPRKNVTRLLEAFSKVIRDNSRKNSHKFANIQLVLVGKKGWSVEEIYQAPKRFGILDRVKFLDYVVDSDLPALYAGAYCFCLPSLHEGFGLPVLEAMASGVPVVISNISSLPELGGNAAVYVDPYNVDSIADGLRQVLVTNTTSYNQLVEKGLKQAQKFSWEKCARETLAVFEKVVNNV